MESTVILLGGPVGRSLVFHKCRMEKINAAEAASNNGSSDSDERTTHTATKFFPNWGTVTTKVTFIEYVDHGDEGITSVIELILTWVGECEQPEEWNIRWVHHLNYLAWELPEYLESYCPAPKEVLGTLLETGLPDDLKREWEDALAWEKEKASQD